ncbi:MAG: lysophospholipid acyltransferase family protein [Elusimicrobiota bacterium]|jgi:KDO2-lipid IV(A) lauroyltransferase
MARSKSSFQIGLEYYPVKAIFQLIAALPSCWAEVLCHRMLRLLLFFLRKRRSLVDGNIAASFPDLSLLERQHLLDNSLGYLAKGITVFVRIPRWKNLNPPWLIPHNPHYLEEALARGQGVLCFTAHFGCWEMMANDVLKRFPHVAIAYRSLDNPRLDRLVADVRSSRGGFLIPRQHLLRQGIRLLKANGILGILIDQNYAPGGVFVDFFGRLAATVPVTSILARRTGATVLPVHNRWIGEELHIFWEAPFELSTQTDSRQAVAEDTAVMTQTVERWVREDPAQWLWLHNRWKRQPKEGEQIFRVQPDSLVQ